MARSRRGGPFVDLHGRSLESGERGGYSELTLEALRVELRELGIEAKKCVRARPRREVLP